MSTLVDRAIGTALRVIGPGSFAGRWEGRFSSVTSLGATLGRQVLWAALVMSACDPNGAESERAGPTGEFDPLALAMPVRQLEGRTLNDRPVIGLPWRIAATDSVLWVSDAAADPAVHVLDAETGEILVSFGRRGDGPSDFESSPTSLQPDPTGMGGVWAFDANNHRLLHISSGNVVDESRRILRLPPVLRIGWVGRHSLREGRLEGIYHLDRAVSDMALSADRRTLYAASMMSAEVSAFRLPPEGSHP